jgi:hypothetical protein
MERMERLCSRFVELWTNVLCFVGMVDTLIPVLVLSAVYVAIFLLFRRSERRFYAPRTYLGSMRE